MVIFGRELDFDNILGMPTDKITCVWRYGCGDRFPIIDTADFSVEVQDADEIMKLERFIHER